MEKGKTHPGLEIPLSKKKRKLFNLMYDALLSSKVKWHALCPLVDMANHSSKSVQRDDVRLLWRRARAEASGGWRRRRASDRAAVGTETPPLPPVPAPPPASRLSRASRSSSPTARRPTTRCSSTTGSWRRPTRTTSTAWSGRSTASASERSERARRHGNSRRR